MAGPSQPHCSLILQLGSGYGQVFFFTSCNPQLLLKHFPWCCPTVLFSPGSSEGVFWTAVASTGLVGKRCCTSCLNASSGYPHKFHPHQWMTNQDWPLQLLRVWSPQRKEMEENIFPSHTCSLSHTQPAPAFSLPTSGTPDSLKAAVKGCRGVHSVKTHQQSRPFQARDQPSIAVRSNKTQAHTSLLVFLKLR